MFMRDDSGFNILVTSRRQDVCVCVSTSTLINVDQKVSLNLLRSILCRSSVLFFFENDW